MRNVIVTGTKPRSGAWDRSALASDGYPCDCGSHEIDQALTAQLAMRRRKRRGEICFARLIQRITMRCTNLCVLKAGPWTDLGRLVNNAGISVEGAAGSAPSTADIEQVVRINVNRANDSHQTWLEQ